MNLINEEVAHEAAVISATGSSDEAERYGGFYDGVEFAEEKITPLMIEFAEWWSENITKSDIPNRYCINGIYTMAFKKEQLLEKFMDQRNEI